MFYVPLAGVSLCFSSATICLFLHLFSLLFLNRGRANRHLYMWERLKGLTPPPLYVHCPNANTIWLGVHIMDHATEEAWNCCRVPAVLIHSSSQIWLSAKGSDNNTFFPHRRGIPLLQSSLKLACLRIVSHPSQDFYFHIRGWQVFMLVVMFRKDEFSFSCTCYIFGFK